jgi:hypothetical protein
MMRHQVLEEIKPEQGNLGQNATLLRNAGSQHVIEGRNPVGSYEQQAIIIQTVNVTDFAAGMKFEFREVGLQENGIEKLGAHASILQLKIVAYSSLPEIFVNRINHEPAAMKRDP